MMTFLYNSVTSILLAFVYPVAKLSYLFGKKSLWERFHLSDSDIPSKSSKRIWIHSASVGESVIARAMAAEIKKKIPSSSIFVSVNTPAGYERLINYIKTEKKSNGSSSIDFVFHAPFDHILITNAFTEKINPDIFIIIETEIWPNLINSISKKNVPITLINAKMSKKALRRYFFISGIIRKALRQISLFCVQSRIYAKRYKMLGVPPEKIEILGNIKFDSLPERSDYDLKTIRENLGIFEKMKVLTAGSTRPGEEEIVLSSFIKILEIFKDSVLILAPRHMNRISEVEKILNSKKLKYIKRSSGERLFNTDANIILGDTLGELINFYRCSDAAFIGGSLRDFGGHNPLEASALGIPVLFGPYMEQIGAKELLAYDAAILIHNSEELSRTVISLFDNPQETARIGSNGLSVTTRFKGVLERTFNLMENHGLI